MRTPDNPDWWYVRAASLLRRVAIKGPAGVGTFRSWYGGSKKRGVRPEQHRDAGGKIIRTCFKQLEQAGLLKKDVKGRTLTPKGQAFLDKAAAVIARATPKFEIPKIRAIVKKEKAPAKAEAEKASPAEAAAPAATAPAEAKPEAKKPAKPRKPRKPAAKKTGEAEKKAEEPQPAPAAAPAPAPTEAA
jgi:small subunit ribosomal protein S19e